MLGEQAYDVVSVSRAPQGWKVVVRFQPNWLESFVFNPTG